MGGFGWGEILWNLLLLCLLSTPLALSVWAILDVANRPGWAWALAQRSRLLWMIVLVLGICVTPVGLVLSGIYLLRVRPIIADAESGIFEA